MKPLIKISLLIFVFIIPCYVLFAQGGQGYTIKGRVICDDMDVAGNAQVFLANTSIAAITDNEGYYTLSNITPGRYIIVAFAYEHTTEKQEIVIENDIEEVNFHLHEPEQMLENVTVESQKLNSFGITRLNAIDGMGIYEGKKSEVLLMDDIIANKATSNARQVYSRVTGLNIWESDCAGIQLGLGGRGLSPNRSSNFNVRQNGVDMSADALGYPESYYSPPVQAVDKIQIVRGAASLQYGTQFGGLINFVLKEPPVHKTISVESSQTYGSYNYINSYNSISGTLDKFDYVTYYQYRTGDCWRCNSDFDAHSAYARTSYLLSDKFKISTEYTFMQYLARQPGGLTDAQFNTDPQRSYRDRNWFRVNWNLPKVRAEYRFSPNTELDSRFFGLIAGREALGNLERIDRTDDMSFDRSLLDGDFRNIGNETRLLHRYSLFDNISSFLGGIRLYSGKSRQTYGAAPNGKEQDFLYRNPDSLDYDYDNSGKNLALFAENIFTLNNRLSITPGIRYENIHTSSNGYFRKPVPRDLAGDPLYPDTVNLKAYSDIDNRRDFILLGLGVSYKPNEAVELYGNFSQNYKSISYNDIRVTTPTLVVDQDITDEKGYSLDVGIRGNGSALFTYEITAFMLMYKNRIGSILKRDDFYRVFRYRTNLGDARNLGIESFFETDILNWNSSISRKSSLNWFVNLTLLNTKYLTGESSVKGNRVEFSPPVNLRSGLSFKRKKLGVSAQISYLSAQFSDASNAPNNPPVPGAVEGTIPAYYVADISARYRIKNWLEVEGSINNLIDNMYFTRRATGYPGPGIIPSDGRTFYLTLTGKFSR